MAMALAQCHQAQIARLTTNKMDDALAKINQHEAECAQFRTHVTYRLDELNTQMAEIKANMTKATYSCFTIIVSLVGYFEYLK